MKRSPSQKPNSTSPSSSPSLSSPSSSSSLSSPSFPSALPPPSSPPSSPGRKTKTSKSPSPPKKAKTSKVDSPLSSSPPSSLSSSPSSLSSSPSLSPTTKKKVNTKTKIESKTAPSSTPFSYLSLLGNLDQLMPPAPPRFSSSSSSLPLSSPAVLDNTTITQETKITQIKTTTTTKKSIKTTKKRTTTEEIKTMATFSQISSPSLSLSLSPSLSPSPSLSLMQETSLTANCDGACLGNGQKGAVAGVGVWFGVNHPLNISEPLLDPRPTNQRAELMAVKRALEEVHKHYPNIPHLTIRSDSQYSIKCVTVWHHKWRATGWKNSKGAKVENRDLIESILTLLESSRSKIEFVHVLGHTGDPGNECANYLAGEGAKKR